MDAIRIAARLYVRNEERDLAEWVVYHATIGFDAFIIYSNKSDDSTAEVVDRFRRIYDIKLIDWPRTTKYSQIEAYDDCLQNFRETFDWIAFIDADEFFAPVRDGTITVFLSHHDTADAVAANWSLFGSSGHDAAPSDLIIEIFTMRAVNDHLIHRNTKTIVRPKAAILVSDPHSISVEGRIVHPDGSLCIRNTAGAAEAVAGFEICRLNHYFTRSREHWNAKMKRGYREGATRGEVGFLTHDTNDVEDLGAARHADRVKAALAAIEALPLRNKRTPGRSASDEREKLTADWLAVRCGVGDLMFRAPDYAWQDRNTLFDPDFYLALYSDVSAAGFDPFLHFKHFGFLEGPSTLLTRSAASLSQSR